VEYKREEDKMKTLKRKETTAAETIKCTLKMPKALWMEGRHRAIDEERDFQDVVSDALKLYLEKVPLKKRGGDL
jgi:hypothetical protein